MLSSGAQLSSSGITSLYTNGAQNGSLGLNKLRFLLQKKKTSFNILKDRSNKTQFCLQSLIYAVAKLEFFLTGAHKNKKNNNN